jgi:hypothetical protein
MHEPHRMKLYSSPSRHSLPSRNLEFGTLLLSLLFLASCASVSTKDNYTSSTPPQQKPAIIYVTDFDTSGEFNVDREGAELADFKTNLQQMMTAALIERLNKYLAPAQYLPAGARPTPGNAWVVRGKFLRVNQGSRALRAVVGFGAGGTKVETAVFIDNLADNSTMPFKAFDTTGGSGAMPGAIASGGPIGAGLKAAAGAAKGLTEDVERTSRMITAELSAYMADHGWIAPDAALNPKRMDQ